MYTETKTTVSRVFFFSLVLIALFFTFTFLSPPPVSGAVWYASSHIETSGDGTTWSTAFKTIQEAIDAATEGDDVWVKKGTYNLSSPITVNKAVGIYGGFAGSETQRDERNWETNITTIDGQDSVLRCFFISKDATIDGLTITGGNANGAPYSGGGIYNFKSSPDITNCTISGNSANYGGGVYNLKSSPTIIDCIISENTADFGGGIYNCPNSLAAVTNCTFSKNSALKSGGGIYNNDNTSSTITNCTFLSNSAIEEGGAVYNGNLSTPNITDCIISENTADFGGGIFNDIESSPTLTNCTLTQNSAAQNGGGMYNDHNSFPIITNCAFSVNSANYAGGIYNGNGSSPTITNCTFSSNSAIGGGGGIKNNDNSSPTITNCTFSENSANWGGGNLNQHCSPAITNCTFSQNSATAAGGGIYNSLSSSTITNCTFFANDAQWGGAIISINNPSPTITNCTLNGNIATKRGGGVDNSGSSPTITNCILWGDTAPNGPEIQNSDTSNPTITYCDIQGGCEGEGNMDSDPLFSDPSNNDFHITSTSPCIDAGNNNAPGIYTTDFEGDPRIADGDNDGIAKVDIGADEYADTDTDGLPDDWERTYFGDTSRDGTCDYDEDGLTDLEEYENATNPVLGDTDGDGMPDGWEVQYGLDPLLDDASGDSDGDIYTNLQEYYSGTDPDDRESIPQPPVADAGTNKTVDEGESVSLNGLNSTDPDGQIVSYLWEQTSGTTVSLSSSTSGTTSFLAPYGIQSSESLTFKLTVTDNTGLKDTATVVITVEPLPAEPSSPDGDVAPLGNRDSNVTVGDALVALRFALTLEIPTSEDIAHGDVAPLDSQSKPSPDGVITVGDALVILRKALGIISF